MKLAIKLLERQAEILRANIEVFDRRAEQANAEGEAATERGDLKQANHFLAWRSLMIEGLTAARDELADIEEVLELITAHKETMK